MKAVIMAGGEGSRLRPLTCDMPKPMARLCGRPILEYILELLSEHGVDRASITLRYLPGRIIEHFPDEQYAGIRLTFVEETVPLGTAGSVKNACTDVDDEILVISGDAMCDFDLSAFIHAHRASGAAVTILGKKVEDPREYGLIDVDGNFRIAGFIEKPAYSQAVSDLANTGIYLLSRSALSAIPDGTAFDFAKDLFPLLLRNGEKLQCWEGEGYWCDVGDLESYAACQRDMLWGKVRCRIPEAPPPPSEPGAMAGGAASVTIIPPIYIGRGVRLEDDAVIECGSVLDDGCVVGRGARITGSVLLPGARVDRLAKLTGAIVCAGATVKAGAMLFEGSTVGAGAVIGEQATLSAGVKVWNGKRVPSFARVSEHVKTVVQGRGYFDDDGISGQIGVELTPEFCARVGAAVGSISPKSRIAVGSSTHRGAAVLKAALCAGIQSTGAHVIDFGSNFQARFEFCMNFTSCELGVFVKGDDRAWLRVMSGGGLPATRDVERSVEGILSRGEFLRAAFDAVGDYVEMSAVGKLYGSQLMRLAPNGLSGCSARVKSHNLLLQNTLRDVLYKLGCDDAGPVTVEISSQGDRLRIFDPAVGTVRYHTVLAVCAAGEMEKGLDVALPFDAPQAVSDMAGALGQNVLRYLTCPADDSDHDARRLAKSQLWSRDALMQAVMFLHLSRRFGGISRLLARYRRFEVVQRTLETPSGPAALLRAVSEHKPGAIAEGVTLNDPRGTVLVKPLKRGNGIRILAEAVSSETARELCDSIEDMLRRAMNSPADDR